MGGLLELNSCCNGLSSLSSISHNSMKNNILSTTTLSSSYVKFRGSSKLLHTRLSTAKIKAVGTIPENDQSAESNSTTTPTSQEPPQVNFAFVSSVLLPDGNMDVRYRTATGGQKLRNIMMDANVELYGPYARPLLNCSGGGNCGTCIVEFCNEMIVKIEGRETPRQVVQGKELLGPRTAVEREKLKKNPKNWRLACQTTVGKPDSTGLVIIQQLPEWKAHEWNYGEPPPIGEEEQEQEEVNEES